MNNLKLYINLLCVNSLIGFYSCCQSNNLETNKIVFEIVELDSWLNLMPGDAPKIHLSGKANIYSESELDNFEGFFKSISIKQNQDQLYSFKPFVNLLNDEINDKELFVYKIEFYTETGLHINPDLNGDKNIDIDFIFSEDLNMKNILLSDIKIEKAY